MPISNAIRNRDLTGTHPFVAGWGATRYGNLFSIISNLITPVYPNKLLLKNRYFIEGPSSDILREVQLPVVSLATCQRAYGNSNSAVDRRVLCAGYQQGGRDSCQVSNFNYLHAICLFYKNNNFLF